MKALKLAHRLVEATILVVHDIKSYPKLKLRYMQPNILLNKKHHS